MKSKLLAVITIISLGLMFQGCEKEEDNSTSYSDSYSNKANSNNSKSLFYGDPNQETLVYNAVSSTETYFSNLNSIPQTTEWFNYYSSIYSSGLTAPNSISNETEYESISNGYFNSYYSEDFPTELNHDQFRDTWLNNISNNTILNSTEKTSLSNIVYITFAIKKAYYIGNINVLNQHDQQISQWDIVFNNCMRKNVPNGMIKRILWVLSGNIFIDVADCMIEAFQAVWGA